MERQEDVLPLPARLAPIRSGIAPRLVAAGGLTTLMLLALVAGLTIGPLDISLAEIVRAAGQRWLAPTAADGRLAMVAVVLFDIRLPRLLAAAVIGAALSTSGAAFQAVFANPLVSPGVLGVLAGASFGAALGILESLSWPMIQTMAFVFGMLASGFALLLAHGVAGNRVLALVLGGVISSALFTALLSLLKTVADPTSQLPAIVFWLMGSLAHVRLPALLLSAPAMLVAAAGLVLLGRSLDVLAMGDEEATALGLPVVRLRLLTVILATLAGSLSVALAGVVGWVGLIVPHVARGLLGPVNRRVMPASAALGASFLMVMDTLCRSLFATEIPLGIATALVGVPFLAILLRRGRQGWHG